MPPEVEENVPPSEQASRPMQDPPGNPETLLAPQERFQRSEPEKKVRQPLQHVSEILLPSGASVYAQIFMSSLDIHFPKKPITRTTTKTPDQLREQLWHFLYLHELSENTKNNYARILSEFQRFLEKVNMIPTNYSAALFIVDLFYDNERRKTLHLNGVYQYAKDLSAACGQERCDSWNLEGTIYMTKVKTILRNMGGAIPHHQAKPMVQEHAYRALTINGWSEEERLVVYAMWKSCSRDVDIVTLNCADCRKEVEFGEELIVFEWVPKEARTGAGSGRTKNNRGRVLTCVLNCGEHTQRLWDYIRKRQKAKLPFTDMTEQQVVKLLQKLDKEYTGHSPKRGGLNQLGRQKVGFELIGRMARHNQPGRDLPLVTELYLEPQIYGLMGRTQDATKLL